MIDLFSDAFEDIGEQVMDARDRASKILEILKKNYSLSKWKFSRRDVFKLLIRTVLSQATNDRNRDRAYKNLSEKYEITPKVLAVANVIKIEDAIRIGGLFRKKSRKIIELSKMVTKQFNGSLDFVHSEPFNEARSKLMTIPGVGPKTADVVLLFSADRPTVPIDTHVNRVSRRLGLAPMKGDYEAVRFSLESLYSPKDYLAVHILLISLGRTYCRVRNPNHEECPVNSMCPIMQLKEHQLISHRINGSG